MNPTKPISFDLIAIPKEEYNSILDRLFQLEANQSKIIKTKVIKSRHVRKIFKDMSDTELRTLIANGTLKPFRLYETGHLYYHLDEVLDLIPRHKTS